MISVESKDFSGIIETLKSKESAETGVLVGYKYQERAYIYAWCPTPKQEVANKSISVLLGMPISIENATYSDWVLQHCKETFRLLPSGLQILGIYSVAEEDLKLENFNLISTQILRLYSDLAAELSLEDTICVFHYNQLDSKYTSGYLDIKVRDTQKKAFQAIEVRQISLAKLEEIRGIYRLDLELGAEGTAQDLVQRLIAEWNIVLDSSVFVIDSQIMREEILLSALKPVNNIQSKSYHTAQIYSQIPGFCCNFDENRVRVTGLIEIMTLSHPKATLKTVKEQIIKDLLFSLKNRVEIISDSYDPEKNPFISPVKSISIQLPRRISFSLNSFSYSGYTSDDPEDFKSVASSLLSAKLSGLSIRETLPDHPETVMNDEKPLVKPSNVKKFWIIWAAFIVIFTYIIKKISS